MFCFDIGGNIGRWTLENINNFDKIICIEASPLTYGNLIRNINNNKVITINKAVSSTEGEIDFYQAQNDVFSTTNKDWLCDTNNRSYGHPYKIIKVPTITIDDLINQYGKPNLIKIDTEGGEYNTIKSLTQKVDNLCFEWASETDIINYNCLDYLNTLGFTHFYLQMEDAYTFRPNFDNYVDKETIKNQLAKTIKKQDWGMIWCR